MGRNKTEFELQHFKPSKVSNNEQLPGMVEQNIVICRRLVICDFHMSQVIKRVLTLSSVDFLNFCFLKGETLVKGNSLCIGPCTNWPFYGRCPLTPVSCFETGQNLMGIKIARIKIKDLLKSLPLWLSDGSSFSFINFMYVQECCSCHRGRALRVNISL